MKRAYNFSCSRSQGIMTRIMIMITIVIMLMIVMIIMIIIMIQIKYSKRNGIITPLQYIFWWHRIYCYLKGNLSFSGGFTSQCSRLVGLIFIRDKPDQAVEHTVGLPIIRDAMVLLKRYYNGICRGHFCDPVSYYHFNLSHILRNLVRFSILSHWT